MLKPLKTNSCLVRIIINRNSFFRFHLAVTFMDVDNDVDRTSDRSIVTDNNIISIINVQLFNEEEI